MRTQSILPWSSRPRVPIPTRVEIGSRNTSGPLTELTTSKGFKAVNEPHESTVGTKTVLQADFKREMGSLTMYQSSLVILTKGYIASLTFIGDSEEDVEKLVSNLTFGSQTAPSTKRP